MGAGRRFSAALPLAEAAGVAATVDTAASVMPSFDPGVGGGLKTAFRSESLFIDDGSSPADSATRASSISRAFAKR